MAKNKLAIQSGYTANLWYSFLSVLHKIVQRPRGLLAVVLLVLLYSMMLFARFIAPYDVMDVAAGVKDSFGQETNTTQTENGQSDIVQFGNQTKLYHPPNLKLWSQQLGFGLQVQEHLMVNGFTKEYVAIKDKYHKVYLFTKKSTVETNTRRHLFGTDSYPVYVFGADARGRDVFSRIVYGSRISLMVGLVGALISLSLALLIGGIAGYYGGAVDWIIMRICEFIILVPSLYIILFLRGIFLDDISPGKTFFLITIILSLIGFPSSARVIRGMIHSIKHEDFVITARLDNMKVFDIVRIHILPHISTILIISISLAIPSFILGETALSFLGLGITDPSVSWGYLLNRNILSVQAIQNYPWQLIPGIFLSLTMLSYILFGECLRDVLDPHHAQDGRL